MFSDEKMYTFIKGFAIGLKLTETLRALSYARMKHSGQFRKDGSCYISHPLTMACNAIAMGIVDDNTLAVILLHDVVEDCNVSLSELPVNDVIRRGVDAITFRVLEGETEEEAMRRYYSTMISSKEATIAKLIDRCHNVSTMAGAFTEEKLVSYIEETRIFVLPLLRELKDSCPEVSNVLFCLKYQINSVMDAIEITLRTHSSKKEEKE